MPGSRPHRSIHGFTMLRNLATMNVRQIPTPRLVASLPQLFTATVAALTKQFLRFTGLRLALYPLDLQLLKDLDD
jgi:hypothetical protein